MSAELPHVLLCSPSALDRWLEKRVVKPRVRVSIYDHVTDHTSPGSTTSRGAERHTLTDVTGKKVRLYHYNHPTPAILCAYQRSDIAITTDYRDYGASPSPGQLLLPSRYRPALH
ncbi:unnamed protein product [Pleuronectes platessa]|uniref:Uncharacterized protein n=1 Tax=Pleuronectes platessa TaxID=8262 RepID=A0A9N7U131_PLEPL|nr:unnamed protein product [Pleuronectes platessa]